MPYIKDRDNIDDKLADLLLFLEQKRHPGVINYIITKILHHHIAAKGLSYATLNEAVGILECAKMELYRMVGAPYEDVKRHENSHISQLDEIK